MPSQRLGFPWQPPLGQPTPDAGLQYLLPWQECSPLLDQITLSRGKKPAPFVPSAASLSDLPSGRLLAAQDGWRSHNSRSIEEEGFAEYQHCGITLVSLSVRIGLGAFIIELHKRACPTMVHRTDMSRL